jgi:hypothetical protein
MSYPARLGLPLLLALIPMASAEGPSWQPVTAAELSQDKPQLEPSAAAEILSYHLEIDDTRSMGRTVTSMLRIKIYDPSRAADITRISRFWNGPANTDYGIKARLTSPDGTVREFDERDLRDRNVAEEGHARGLLGVMTTHSDRVVSERFLAVTGVAKGSVLDVWEIEPNIYKTEWVSTSVQRADAPILAFDYVSRYIPTKDILHHGFVLSPHGGKMANDEAKGVLRFSAENLPSIRRESYSAPDSYFSLTIIETSEYLTRALDTLNHSVPLPQPVPLSLGPWAFFSTAQDYQDADKGYASSRVKEKADELTAGVTDPREKARKLYEYVQALYQRFRNRADLENWYTRYVHSIDELISLDKIDSTVVREQDFRFLLVGLARSAGLECHTVYHPLRTSFPFRVDFVDDNFLQGRTVAVKTGDSWVLCEPTADVPMPFGEVSWNVEGQPGLLAMPRQQTFLEIPPLAAENSRTETNIDLRLDASGTLEGQCVQTLTGHAAHEARQELDDAGQEKWARMARSLLSLENSSCEVRLLKVDGLHAPEGPLRIDAAVRWPSYAPVLGDRMTFVLSVLTEGRPPLLNESERKTPVFFRYPQLEKETIVIHLPQGFRPGTLPKPIEAASGDFSYLLTAVHDPEHALITIERTTTNNSIGIPVSGYAAARNWFRRVSVADQIGIVLSHTAPAPSK